MQRCWLHAVRSRLIYKLLIGVRHPPRSCSSVPQAAGRHSSRQFVTGTSLQTKTSHQVRWKFFFAFRIGSVVPNSEKRLPWTFSNTNCKHTLLLGLLTFRFYHTFSFVFANILCCTVVTVVLNVISFYLKLSHCKLDADEGVEHNHPFINASYCNCHVAVQRSTCCRF